MVENAPHPVGGIDHPRTLKEFDEWFASEAAGTESVNLAALAASNGVPVAIVDLDPQASASAWCVARRTDDIRHEACHPPLLARTLERLCDAGFALIVIDTPPHNSTAAANAMGLGLRGR